MGVNTGHGTEVNGMCDCLTFIFQLLVTTSTESEGILLNKALAADSFLVARGQSTYTINAKMYIRIKELLTKKLPHQRISLLECFSSLAFVIYEPLNDFNLALVQL